MLSSWSVSCANTSELDNRQPDKSLSEFSFKERSDVLIKMKSLHWVSLLTFVFFLLLTCTTSFSSSGVHFSLPVHHVPLVLFVFPTPLAPNPEAVQRHLCKCPRPGNASLADKNASILWLHSAKSGWVRAACKNSCSESDQKKERDFFDYYLFVHLALKLFYTLGPHWMGCKPKEFTGLYLYLLLVF